MNKFKPKSPQEKVLFFFFESKVEISEALELSVPTVDRICESEDMFLKYLHKIADATDMKNIKLLQAYWRFRDGL